MRFIAYAVLLALTFAFVRPLCQPQQWEGVEEAVCAYSNEHKHGIWKAYTRVHYDYKNRRSTFDINRSDNGSKSITRVITIGDGDSGEVYVIAYPKGTCKKYKLTNPFRPTCIPSTAKRGANVFLGGMGNLNLTTYYNSLDGVNTMFAVVEKDGVVVPVLVTVQGKQNYYDIFQTAVHEDVSLGIKDESVFNVPKVCEEGNHDNPQFFEDQPLPRDFYGMAL